MQFPDEIRPFALYIIDTKASRIKNFIFKWFYFSRFYSNKYNFQISGFIVIFLPIG